MRRLSIIFFCILFNSSYCQENENKLLNYQDAISKEFKDKNITQYLFLSNNCPLNISISQGNLDDRMISVNEFIAYLVWKEQSKIFIKKISNKNNFNILNEFSSFEILDFDPFKFINEHKFEMEKEKVLDYEILTDGERVSLSTPINCLTKFNIYLDTYTIQKDFFESNLVKSNYIDDNGILDEKVLNLNFKSNNNLRIIELFRRLNQEINSNIH